MEGRLPTSQCVAFFTSHDWWIVLGYALGRPFSPCQNESHQKIITPFLGRRSDCKVRTSLCCRTRCARRGLSFQEAECRGQSHDYSTRCTLVRGVHAKEVSLSSPRGEEATKVAFMVLRFSFVGYGVASDHVRQKLMRVNIGCSVSVGDD